MYKYVYILFIYILPRIFFIVIICDTFSICTNAKEQHTECFSDSNEQHDSTEFEYKVSQTSITFFDTEVFKITNLSQNLPDKD